MHDAMRREALRIFDAGLAAADPGRAVRASLEAAPLPDVPGRTFVVAVGKAARGMARALCERVAPDEVLVVTNYENARPLEGARVLAAGHPVPDENGLKAGEEVIALLGRARAGDRVIALISGGGSALLPAPVEGVSLADKAETGRLLLGAGLVITAMNLVRQQLSRLKGGGFLRLAAPARVAALILSDVVGDDLRVIASGPTVAPIGSRAEAVALLKEAEVWEKLPGAVRRHLSAPAPSAGPLPEAENRLVGSNALSVAAMKAAAPEAAVHPEPLVGDVAEAAAVIAGKGPGVHLFGGETTVRLRGHGMGGRNQELALRVALEAEARGWRGAWVFLSGGTDGRDGPTDAAGGLVDDGTLAAIRSTGADPMALLADNDSYHALKAGNALLITGPTGTNVADLQVLIRAGC